MNNAVIYARFSSAGQNEQSIETQIKTCKEIAEQKGFKIINTYSDKARTGTNDDRPAFQRMIADAQSGTFQYILVYMFDRFARNRRDSIMYKELLKEKYGIRVMSALEPVSDDEGGEFYEMFLEWNAEKYSKRLSKRVKDGIDTSVANGTYCGGYICYGYKLDIQPTGERNKTIKKVIINHEQAKVIKYLFEEYDKGTTKKDIAKSLNEQGYRYFGKPFTVRSFDNWLRIEKYTGEFKFGGRPCNNMYPQIIDKTLFQRVQKRLDENKYFAGGIAKAREPYLLTGKVYCGHCGSPMIADGTNKASGIHYRWYRCKLSRGNKCNKKMEVKENLERYVIECIRDFLSNPDNVKKAVKDTLAYYEKRTDKDSLKSVETKIAVIQKEVEELADSFVKAKSELLRNTIEKKMGDYEILLDNLLMQKSKLELERGYKLTEKDLTDFIAEILKGDPNDKTYQQSLISHLVDKVIVNDTHTIVTLNIKGNSTQPIDTKRLSDTIISDATVQMQSPLPCQLRQYPNFVTGVQVLTPLPCQNEPHLNFVFGVPPKLVRFANFVSNAANIQYFCADNVHNNIGSEKKEISRLSSSASCFVSLGFAILTSGIKFIKGIAAAKECGNHCQYA
jgi:DNA invertase Pin-like site-specific DNA recombinase